MKLTKIDSKNLESEYLMNLMASHSSSLPYLSEALKEKQSKYEEKIIEGEYQIRKQELSLMSYNSVSQKDLQKFKSKRDSLASQFNVLSKVFREKEVKKMMLTDTQRKRFVSEKIQQQRKLNKKKEQKLLQQQRKRREIQQIKQQMEQQQQREKKDKKKRQIERRLEEMAQQKQRRQEENRYRNRQLQQISSEKLLLHKMVQNFNQIQNVSLEEKKKKLAKIRQLHRPLRSEDFDQHIERIKQFKQIKQQQKELEQSSRIQENSIKWYKSKWYKQVLGQKKIDQSRVVQEIIEQKMQLKDKAKKYAEYIKHNFIPDIDEKLAEDIIKRYPSPTKAKKAKQVRQMGISNLRYSKQKAMPKQQLQNRNQQKMKTSEPIKVKPKNYLQQFKQKRRNTLDSKFLSRSTSKSDKVQQVKKYAEILQQKAKRKQLLKKVGKEVNDQQLDELYIKALDAKLNLLNKKNK